MKTALYGRLIFGASAVLFGVIALIWHDPDTWQSMHRILSLPFGTIVGGLLMIAQILGGIGLVYSPTTRVASIVLGVVYALFAVACIPGIVAHPKVFGEYDGFFEQFALVSGALAAYAATEANAARALLFGRAGRMGLGISTVAFTLAQIIYFQITVGLVPKWIPPNQTFWAILTTIAFALAAAAMLVNRRARLAMRLMTLMLALFGALVWIPLLVAHPEQHANWSEFALNFLITGAAGTVAELRSF
ncbi:MAG TPA: hypothetical protein VGI19_14390 [Candidatus Cybelea sp.]|jgi:uncharacterized membrane protein